MVARLIPFYEFGIDDFFCSDGAPAEVATKRREGFFPARGALQGALRPQPANDGGSRQPNFRPAIHAIYRVPFQFSRMVRENLPTGAFLQSSSGVTITDLDGNLFYDLTGSYGVNLFGYDFYKECIASAESARELGPVLGFYHPVVADNVAGCAGFPGSTKSRSTCRAPKR